LLRKLKNGKKSMSSLNCGNRKKTGNGKRRFYFWNKSNY
jgi:hypothetical protein